jgi:hypothetical protein
MLRITLRGIRTQLGEPPGVGVGVGVLTSCSARFT